MKLRLEPSFLTWETWGIFCGGSRHPKKAMCKAMCYVLYYIFFHKNVIHLDFNVKDHSHYAGKYRGAAQSICSLKYIAKEISMIFQNRPNYDYHFIKKQLAEKFEREFNCLAENTEKYKTFSVSKEKEVKRIGKNKADITKTISFKLQLIDSATFTASSLSNFVNNLAERIHKKLNVNMDMIMENVKRLKLNTKTASAALNTQTLNMI